MKNCAVFTIVKNEKYHLPKWVNHYKKYFNKEDIYVLDHETKDGSTNNIDVNVVKVYNELAFDHGWLHSTVYNFKIELLKKYKCILFSEVDEIVYSVKKPLNETISDFINSDIDYYTCIGYDLYHDLNNNESSLLYNDPILKYRNRWIKQPLYNKTLLTKISLNWSAGFHYINIDNTGVNYHNDLFLLHLHKVDFNLMIERHNSRLTNTKVKDDGGGWENKITSENGIRGLILSDSYKSELIPNEHKKVLDEL